MATGEKAAPAGYTISLFVSRTTPEHKVKEGYSESTIPRDTVELGRIELRGGDLATLLAKTRDHLDLIEEV